MIEQDERIIKKAWVPEIEYMRAFAILAVLILHTVFYFLDLKQGSTLATVLYLIDSISLIGVPIFLFISGFTNYRSYHGDILNFYKKRLLSVIPQYILVSLLYQFFFYFLLINKNKLTFSISFNELITFSSAHQLWFVLLILEFYLLTPIIIYIYRRFSEKKHELLLLILVYGFNVLINIYHTYTHNLYFIFFDNALKITSIGTLLFYFVLGIYCSHHLANIKKFLECRRKADIKYLITIVLLWFVIITPNIFDYSAHNNIRLLLSNIGQMIGPILFALVIVYLFKVSFFLSSSNSFIKKVLLQIGKFSFLIFLIHVFFNEIIIRILDIFGVTIENPIFYLLLFFFSLLLSLLSSMLIAKVDFMARFMGIKGKQ